MEIFIGDECIKSSVQQTPMKDYYIEHTAEYDLNNYYRELGREAFNAMWYDTDRPECMRKYAAIWDNDQKVYRVLQYTGKGQYEYLDDPDRCWLVSKMKKVIHWFVFADTTDGIYDAIEKIKRQKEIDNFHTIHPVNNTDADCHCPSCNHPLNVDPFKYESIIYYEGCECDEIIGLADNVHIKCKCGHEVNIKPKIAYEIS